MSSVPIEKPVVLTVASKSELSAAAAAATPEIRIYGHSTLLYWWPVWVIGFAMAALTYAEGSHAALVPAGAEYDSARNVIVLPAGATLAAGGDSELGELTTRNKNPGVFFAVSLLLVVFITNTPLRGLWSAIVVLSVLLGTVTLAWMGLWGDVLHAFGRISIHLSMGFYLFFSGLLFLLWVAVVFGLDRTHYWRFRPGQLTRESVMGGGEKSYDTGGMSFEKLRDDPFRHYLLGLGSGDLVINTSGAQREQLRIPNVLFVGGILVRLQKLISERPA